MNKRQRKKADKKARQQWQETGYDATSYLRGHEIKWDGVDWRYSDDDSIADKDRPCVRCNKLPTKEGHDACLGHIGGVKAACCGHGIDGDKYIWYEGEKEERSGQNNA